MRRLRGPRTGDMEIIFHVTWAISLAFMRGLDKVWISAKLRDEIFSGGTENVITEVSMVKPNPSTSFGTGEIGFLVI